jgi:N-acetylglucosamine kinase-like BadF-type ATPase
MILLVADSGSTKTEWCLTDNGIELMRCRTAGINPFLQSTASVSQTIQAELLPFMQGKSPVAIYFYGAGCSSSDRIKIVAEAISEHFKDADISVEHDLLAAARALCGTSEGMAAILGTGSNSCVFDGSCIVENNPSLGYVLGDEGSGGYMGMRLIRDYLNRDLPADLNEMFMSAYHLSKDDVLVKVYKQPFANRFFASFVPFIKSHLGNPYVNRLAADSMDAFFDKHICKYDRHSQLPLHSVGSVGFYFSDFFMEAAERRKIKVGKIIQSPLDELVKYHLELI